MKIKDIPYSTDFYWKKERYTQFIRLKSNKRGSKVVCYKTYDQMGGYYNMPVCRKVKPVIRLNMDGANDFMCSKD